MWFRKLATMGGIGVAGLALIGAGATATFTQNTVSNQQVTAGTMNVQLSTEVAGADLSTDGHTLTLPAFGPTNSTFTTGDQLVTITNNSNITVQEIFEQIGYSGPDQLKNELYVCEVSSGTVIYNGPLAGGLSQQQIQGSLLKGATDSYYINVYAGSTANTMCGSVTTIGSPIPASPGPNPAATDLQNDVQGQSGTVSVTLTYQG